MVVDYINKRTKCLLLHTWRVDLDTGRTIYRECEDCGRREITQPWWSWRQPAALSYLLMGFVPDNPPPPPTLL